MIYVKLRYVTPRHEREASRDDSSNGKDVSIQEDQILLFAREDRLLHFDTRLRMEILSL